MINMTFGLVLTIAGGVLSAVLTAFGSARMVGKVGESASGVISQDPTLFSKVLLLQLLRRNQKQGRQHKGKSNQ